MRHNAKRKMQAGFTLIELIVVIVIVGILAAVAIPKFSDTTVAARTAVQDATLGALKSAWASVYAQNKGTAPTLKQVADQMLDPVCDKQGDGTTALTAASTNLSCTGVTKTDGTGVATFTSNSGATVTSPAQLVVSTR